MAQRRNEEKHQPNQREIQQMAPRLRGNESDFGSDVVFLIKLRCRLNVVGQKFPATVAMQLQLLDAFGQRAEGTVQLIFLFARQVQRLEGAAHDEPVANRADHNQSANREQNRKRKPAQIRCTAEEHRHIYRNNRNGEQRLSDVENIIRKPDQYSRRADLFEVPQRNSQNLPHQIPPKLRHRTLRKIGQHRLRDEVGGQLRQTQRDKGPNEQIG